MAKRIFFVARFPIGENGARFGEILRVELVETASEFRFGSESGAWRDIAFGAGDTHSDREKQQEWDEAGKPAGEVFHRLGSFAPLRMTAKLYAVTLEATTIA